MNKDGQVDVSVVDVYDSAAVIGKDFEYLIEQYGVEAVTDIMPKVIRVLEQLEGLAIHYEKETSEVAELQGVVKRLDEEKSERFRERKRYDQELEQIEETWRKESKEMLDLISKLQGDNRRLRSSLDDQSAGELALLQNQEEQVVADLKKTVSKQQGQIKQLQRDAQTLESEYSTVTGQLDKVLKENGALKARARSASTTSRSEAVATEVLLEEERNVLESSLVQTDTQIRNIKDMIQQQEKAQQILDLPVGGDVDQMEGKMNLIGKLMSDMKESKKPRYSISELKDLLQERNTLRMKLMEVEEELACYKQRESGAAETSWADEEKGAEEVEERGVVQGPINREPFEKLYPNYRRPESGIRKFFNFLGFRGS